MRKRKAILSLVLAAMLCGCAANSPAAAPAPEPKTPEPTAAAETAAPAEATVAPAESKDEGAGESGYTPVRELDEAGMKTLIQAYDSVMNETFGADIDFTKPDSSDDLAQYYAVKNFKSVQEIRDYITTYVKASLIDEKSDLAYDFVEKDGKVLAIRGGRGYGYYGIDPDSFQKISDTSAKVQFTLMNEAQKDAYATISFEEENGMWKVAGITLPEGY